MTSRCYVAMLHIAAVFRMQSFNIICGCLVSFYKYVEAVVYTVPVRKNAND